MAGAAPASDRIPPHLPRDQLPNVYYCIDSPPPWPVAILLGFQHYLVMLGNTVIIPTALVPEMGGGNGEHLVAIFLWDQTACCCRRFLYYTFVMPTISSILSGRWSDEDPALVGAFKQLLSPLSVVPLISVVGFGLYEFGFPMVAKCVEVGLPELVLLVIVSQYIIRRYAVIFAVAIVWIYAHLLTVCGAYNGKPPKSQASCRTDHAGLIDGAPWISIPYPLQWGTPSFDAGEAFAMMMATFVALVEGVGILLSGLFGTGNGSSVSVENAGLLALTRVGSRRVVQISAVFMIFFSILGKFGAALASVPAPVVGALYCVLFAYIGAGGINFLQFCNLNSFCTKFILGFSIFLGLSVPQYFKEYTASVGYGPVHTRRRWLNDMVNVPFSSKAFVAGTMAYFLDNTLHRRYNQTRKDIGMHWWDRFRSFKVDQEVRNSTPFLSI